MADSAGEDVYHYEHTVRPDSSGGPGQPVLLPGPRSEGWALLQVCSPSNRLQGPELALRGGAFTADRGSKDGSRVRTVLTGRVAESPAAGAAAVQLARALKIGDAL